MTAAAATAQGARWVRTALTTRARRCGYTTQDDKAILRTSPTSAYIVRTADARYILVHGATQASLLGDNRRRYATRADALAALLPAAYRHDLLTAEQTATAAARAEADKVTFARHGDSWAIVGPARLVRPGATVTATRRDGTTSVVAVATVIGHHTRGTMATIAAAGPPARGSSNRGKGGICAECNQPRRNLTECLDSSGIPGMCCPRCAGLPAVERSFA